MDILLGSILGASYNTFKISKLNQCSFDTLLPCLLLILSWLFSVTGGYLVSLEVLRLYPLEYTGSIVSFTISTLILNLFLALTELQWAAVIKRRLEGKK
jgi:hypothetical protein